MPRFSIAVILTATLFFSCNKEPDGSKKDTTFNPINKTTLSINGWEISKSVYDFSINSRDVFFLNSDIGFVVGYNGDIYKTTDGGSHWTKTKYPFINFGTLHFYNENEGFNIENISAYEGGDFPAFKGSISYETKDGGATWSKSDLIESLHLGLTYFPQREVGFGFNGSDFYTIKKFE